MIPAAIGTFQGLIDELLLFGSGNIRSDIGSADQQGTSFMGVVLQGSAHRLGESLVILQAMSVITFQS